MIQPADLNCATLGPCLFDSPLKSFLEQRPLSDFNLVESDRILFVDLLSQLQNCQNPATQLPTLEPARPHKKIFFNPAETRAGIVTCGGLCPGLNNVIRAIVMELYHHYGVKQIYGFQNGFAGFVSRSGHDVLELTPQSVSHIHEFGGTILGTSRGEQDTNEIVDCLERMKINVLFVIGGDGTMRGALGISQAARKRGRQIAVVGIPKTIDNDISHIDMSFGFQTATSVASESIRAAHVEARGAPNGVGLVRLMGRHSGYIACYAALAKSEANFVLIPEVPFQLHGTNGLLTLLRQRVQRRGHAVIVVAEGAGQELLDCSQAKCDASGNKGLVDIGLFLKDQISNDFKSHNLECNLKYIDPSYLIRSVPANPADSVYCLRLGHNAVHIAMAGRTEAIVARCKNRFAIMPIPLCVSRRNMVDSNGDLWMSVLEATGQPAEMK